jgi:hypothetical protein
MPGGPHVADSAEASSATLILRNVITVHLFIHVFVYRLREVCDNKVTQSPLQ